jgi:hypothetical protein
MRGLRRLNVIAGFAHLVQMILILILATDFALPITAAYVEGPPGTLPSNPVTLVDVRVAWGVAAFFGLSALFHFLVASPLFYGRYVAGLLERHNYFRWVEYSLSSSIMIVLIAQIVGIFDVAAIVAIFCLSNLAATGEAFWVPPSIFSMRQRHAAFRPSGTMRAAPRSLN